MSGKSEQLSLKIMEGGVERGLRRLLARSRRETRADLLQGKRVVSDELAVLLDEPDRGLGGLVVALDRRGLPVSGRFLVAQSHMDDVCVVGGIAGDDEGLRQLQPHDPGLDLHFRAD